LRRPQRLATGALGAYSLLLAFILLGPSAAVPTESVSYLARIAADVGVPGVLAVGTSVEFVCNILIIAPVSFLGAIVFPRLNWRDWTVVGLVLSGTVELCQALFLVARSASFEDVVANTLGAGLGAALYRLVLSIL
jgi:VanZ like family